MSILKVETGAAVPNFLDSEIGLVLKTRQIPQSMGVEKGANKTVVAGTVFPANDATAVGIVLQDVDVTDGDAIGSVLMAGRVLKDRLDASDEAVSAMCGFGLVFIDENGLPIKPPTSGSEAKSKAGGTKNA